jgi:hypothetical protein
MIRVGDTENKHYQIWKLKSDGSESVAYSRLQELGDPVGKTIEIGYNEDQGDFNGKAVTYKTIFNIKPANGATPRIPSKADMFVKAQMTEASKKTDDAKWTEINDKKEKSMRWMNALNNATNLVAAGKIDLKDLKFNANLIYEMSPLEGEDTAAEQAEVYREIGVDNIPF